MNQVKHISSKQLELERNATILSLEKKLEEANQKFEILTRTTNEAIRDCDLQNNHSVVWNHGLTTLFGYKNHSIGNTCETWADKIHPADKEDVLRELNETQRSIKINWNGIYRFKCASNVYKYIYDRVYIVYDQDKPIRMIGTMQDIDDRMIAMAENERLSLVASKTDNLVIITDGEEKIEWVNDAFVKRTGYTLQEVMGKTTRILQGPDTDNAAMERISQRIQNHESIDEEVLNYTKSGKPFWVKNTINPVFDDANKLARCVVVQTDMTAHKEYQSKITTIARDLSDLIENANAIILGIDANGLVNEWNTHAIITTGYEKSDVFGKELASFIVEPGKRHKAKQKIEFVLKDNHLTHEEFEITKKNGKNNILLLSATPRRNSVGEIVGIIAVGQDITELTEHRKSLEEKVLLRTEELNIALAREKELSTVKTRFASMVSHEFRTPLSTIRLSVNHIKRYKNRLTPESIDTKIDTVLQQVDHMSHLLEDVLTLGKTHDVTIRVDKSTVDIVAFCHKIKGEVEGYFGKSHVVKCTLSFTEKEIQTDEGLLRNIFINLIGNGVKFSPGKPTVFLNVTESNGGIRFDIKDEGIGVAGDDLERIFEPFDRGSNAGAIPGTGLGLSIVKKAIDLLGGTITVSSKLHEGSVFSVFIPNA
ncbi:MAG: PAS domain S-box protein [Chryseolinea sp.]